MDLSDFSGVGDSDDRLQNLLHEFLDSAADELDRKDIPEKQVSQLQARDGYAEHKEIKRPDLSTLIAGIDWLKDCDEAIRFSDHLTSEYNEDIDEHYISNLLVDAYGVEGENLDSYDDRIGEMKDKIIMDVNDIGKAELIAPLDGLKIEANQIPITKDIVVKSFKEGETLGEDSIPLLTDSLIGDERVYNDSYLRIEFKEDNELTNNPEQAIELYTMALSLSLGGWVQAARIYIDSITYKMVNRQLPLVSGRRKSYSTRIDPKNASQIQETLRLLSQYYYLTPEQYEPPFSAMYNFRPPINIAISHYGNSIQMWEIPHISVTFAIIGLESLYLQHTAGNTASSEVPPFVGFLLGNTVKEFDPLTIANYVDEGYHFRNQWAHGSKSSDEPSDLQKKLWGVLRASIVVYGWLDSNTSKLDQDLAISDAFIDESTRDSLKNELDRFSLSDYMPVRQNSFYLHDSLNYTDGATS